jgi:hypothetical protein
MARRAAALVAAEWGVAARVRVEAQAVMAARQAAAAAAAGIRAAARRAALALAAAVTTIWTTIFRFDGALPARTARDALSQLAGDPLDCR